jgi:predicted PurR-regulated permease PerM
MNRRTRKLAGTIVMLLFVVLYALVVTAVADPILSRANKAVEAVFYVIAGLAWAPPLMLLIKWMEGGKDETRPQGPV